MESPLKVIGTSDDRDEAYRIAMSSTSKARVYESAQLQTYGSPLYVEDIKKYVVVIGT